MVVDGFERVRGMYERMTSGTTVYTRLRRGGSAAPRRVRRTNGGLV